MQLGHQKLAKIDHLKARVLNHLLNRQQVIQIQTVGLIEKDADSDVGKGECVTDDEKSLIFRHIRWVKIYSDIQS